MNSLSKIFVFYLKEKRFELLDQEQLNLYEKSDKLNADEKYRLWMNKRYNDYKELLIDYLNGEQKSSRKSGIKVDF